MYRDIPNIFKISTYIAYLGIEWRARDDDMGNSVRLDNLKTQMGTANPQQIRDKNKKSIDTTKWLWP